MIAALEPDATLEVFTESGGPEAICFRRVCQALGGEIVYEAGLGQAMYVFEAEQGVHGVLAARSCGDAYSFMYKPGTRSGDLDERRISEALSGLLRYRSDELELRTFSICRALGMDSVAIEGYYTPDKNILDVVDIDLPLDFVFF